MMRSKNATVALTKQEFIAGAVILSLILGGLFFEFVRTQIRWGVIMQSDWGHTLVVPFICVYLAYIKRAEIFAEPLKVGWGGLVPMVAGVAWYMLCWVGPDAIVHHNLQGFGAWLTVCGVAVLFFGYRPMRWLWLPLVYLLVFGQTIGERFLNPITYKLQDITAAGSALVLQTFYDATREGNQITMYDSKGTPIPLNIAEACSGMRMLMAFLALGTAMAYTGLDKWWQRIVLVVMGVPTAVFVNILRVVTLGILSLVNPGLAEGNFHGLVGLVWLLPALVIYLGVMWVVQNIVVEDEGPARTARGKAKLSTVKGAEAQP